MLPLSSVSTGQLPIDNNVLPLVGLITIWYRAKASDMDRFVASLEALDYPRLQPVFVIHDQTDDEIMLLHERVPQAVIINAGGNLGTSAGWNLGIRHLLTNGADYIGIWNVDVRPAPEYLTRLVDVLEQDDAIGAVAPLLFYSDEPKKVQVYGASFDVRTGLSRHEYNGVTDISLLPITRDVGYLDGGTVVIRACILRRIEGFDERMFMYVEDSDMSVRIQGSGFRTVAVRDAHAWHYHRENKGQFPPPYELFYITRNRLYVVRKYGGLLALLELVARLLLVLPRRAVHYIRRRKPTLLRAYVEGLWYGILGRMGKQGWVR